MLLARDANCDSRTAVHEGGGGGSGRNSLQCDLKIVEGNAVVNGQRRISNSNLVNLQTNRTGSRKRYDQKNEMLRRPKRKEKIGKQREEKRRPRRNKRKGNRNRNTQENQTRNGVELGTRHIKMSKFSSGAILSKHGVCT